MDLTKRALAALLLAVLAACGSRTPPPDEPLIDVDDPEATGGKKPSATPTAPLPEPVRRREGEIARADLVRVLDAGEGRFLASVEVKANVLKGKFGGWRVVKSPYADVDLRPDDVILSVNDRMLEHPLELNLLWDDLRKADVIVVEVDRGGERFTLRFTIAPPAAPTPAAK